MEIEAAPHPSRGWCTKGTSIHKAGADCAYKCAAISAKNSRPDRALARRARLLLGHAMSMNNGDHDDDNEGNHKERDKAEAQYTAGDFLLHVRSTHCKAGQFLIRECWDSCLDLDRVIVGIPHGALGDRRVEQIGDRLDILLPRMRSALHLLLQCLRAHQMFGLRGLSEDITRESEKHSQCGGNECS